MFRNVLFFLAAGAIFLLCFGCSKKAEERIAGRAADSCKPAAPVSIEYSVPAKTDPGQTARIDITITSTAAADNILLSYSAGEGLSLASPAVVHLGKCTPGGFFSETVSVVSSGNGLKYLNVFVNGMFGKRNMTRSAAVPISFGANPEPALKKAGTPSVDSQGKHIIILPARKK